MDHQQPDPEISPEDAPDRAEEDVIGEIEPEEIEEPEPEEQPPARPHRRRSRMIGCLLAILGALAGAGLALWVSRDTLRPEQSIDQVQITPDMEGELPAHRLVFSPTPQRPDQTPEIISAETEVIWAFYDLARVPTTATLSATWSHEGRPLGDLPLEQHEPESAAEHARGRFVIHPPAADEDADAASGGFPIGIYQVQVTSPDYPDVVAEASFVALPRAAQILEGGGEPEGPPVIRSLDMATGVTEAGDAVGVGTTFPADAERIMALFSYAGIVPGSTLTVRWHYGDRELTRARTEIAVTAAQGSGEAWLETGGDDRLPVGDYQVTVHLGDEASPLATTGFTVTEPGSGVSPTS